MRNFAVVSLAVAVLLFCAWPTNAEDNEEVGNVRTVRAKRGLKDAMEHFKTGLKELTKDFQLPSLPSLPGFGKKPESGSSGDSGDSGDNTDDTSGSEDDQSKDDTDEES